MNRISSLDNPKIKLIAKLKNKKHRYKQGRFTAEGRRACSSLIDAGLQLEQLYITNETLKKVPSSVKDQQITIVSQKIMKRISQATTPCGLLAVFSIPEQPDNKKLGPGLVLANITDPGNMGTLIRTAAAMNIHSVVIVQGTDPWSAKVVQSSAGTIGAIDIFSWTWKKLIRNKGNLKLYALVVSGGKRTMLINKKDALLVVGSEAHGISNEWLDSCYEKITLPMPGKTESLNAAIAGSIALYLVFGR